MVALVTGGSRGIGLGIVRELLRKDIEVVAAARKESGELKTLAAQYPGRLCFAAADISDMKSIEALSDFVREKYGAIDLLVNNAGAAPIERKDILEITAEDFDYLIGINLKGTFFVTQKFVPLLIKSGRSRIVNISSLSAYTASVNRGEYCISKAGISMATKLFAARLAEYGVSVLEIRPGIIETDMTSSVKEKYEKMIDDGLTPVKRLGQPEDVAKCVAAIADGSFDFCTGTVINCDGGFSVRRL